MNKRYNFEYLFKYNVDTQNTDILIKIMIYPIVIPITWFLLNYTKIKANTITFIGLIVGTSGGIAGMFLGEEFILYGFIVFFICDFLDGRVAAARDGGTPLGMKLDIFTDRFVFSVLVFALMCNHVKNFNKIEILMLFLYYILFNIYDILTLGSLMVKVKYNEDKNFNNYKVVNNTLKNNFLSFMVWLPSRLSSYLIIIIVYIITKSYSYSYAAGILAILIEKIKYTFLLKE